jgi:hypothetical protein
MLYSNIREGELKNKIAADYFGNFDNSREIGNVDFCVTLKTNQTQDVLFPTQSLVWAEAKAGKSDIYKSFVQLILTIGKARTFDRELPPSYLGAFDAFQIAFIPYSEIQEIFYQTDFNWNVPPSNYETKEFKQIYNKVEQILTSQSLIFAYENDEKELKEFIKTNFVAGKNKTTKIQIDKNNFVHIYNKWLKIVKPSISFPWESAKKANISDSDFYLADLFSQNNETIKEGLFAILKNNEYELDRKFDDLGIFNSRKALFNDNQKAHNQFWNRYKRPPIQEHWHDIIKRKEILLPQDVRERKGSFFTPQIWVEKSQEYLTDSLGENWQDEYYIWDCCAGTGNLLVGLVNKYNIYGSTLDQSDVNAIQDDIKNNGANLLENHVFQFDFLNDSFDDPKVPESLRKILQDEEKRKKLVIYINPPYAEHVSYGEKQKAKVATETKVYQDFQNITGTAGRELFAQFFLRIYKEISGSTLGSFSTLKYINSQNFYKFRQYFKAEFQKGFIVPADTFDNVKGAFPIGFLIWNTDKKEDIKNAEIDVFDSKNNFLQKKTFSSYQKGRFIIDWLREFYDKKGERIAYLRLLGTDMQTNKQIFITLQPSKNDFIQHTLTDITQKNLIPMSIYLSVRHCIKATWLNDRDQFLFPNDGWKKDMEFQNDCLAFTLFHGQNRISSKQGVNNWIPFTETEVNSPERFDSHFMTDFIGGRLDVEEKLVSPKSQTNTNNDELKFVSTNNEKINLSSTTENTNELFTPAQENFIPNKPLEFSPESKEVFEAGRELWRYYFEKISQNSTENVFKNPSLYDIKSYFQRVDEKGRMNNKSNDEKYNLLITNLRESLEILAAKIQPKVYEFGLLKG